MSDLKYVDDVTIDDGVFKYILINVTDSTNKQKLVVRGFEFADYHMDVFQHSKEELDAMGLGFKAEVCGGGRIRHDVISKNIHVYGYSVAFGAADHAKAVEILRKKYSDYEITFSYEGY